jgi:hypothetical protein
LKRHRTDLLSMFSGAMFLTIGGVFLTGRVDVTDLESQWLWSLPLLLAGLLIFAAAFRREPRAAADHDVVDETIEDEPAEETEPEPEPERPHESD